jgi:hypothetical protein
MKTRAQAIVLAASCFLTGFVACYWLMQQPHSQRKPAIIATPQFPPFAVLSLPTVSTQTFRIDEGFWYQWPDGTMQRSPTPQMRPSYYDLIDTRADLLDLK